jgi:hypothetical protein
VAYDIRAHKIILFFKTQLDAKYELCGKIFFFPIKGHAFAKNTAHKWLMGEVTASL